MNSFDGIAIEVNPKESSHTIPNAAYPILSEIETMLWELAEHNRSNSIDLRRQPLSQTDSSRLREVLGRGEVSATVNCMGTTHIEETGIPGVWWVTHYNDSEDVVAEFIEITEVPEILKAHRKDIPAGVGLLRARVARLSHG